MKLAVFDLDGTIWKNNSHKDLVYEYYQINFIQKILFSIHARLNPGWYMDMLNAKFDAIPDEYIMNFQPDWDERMLSAIEKCVKQRYNTIIITNAPDRIVNFVKNKLRIETIHGDIGKKSEALKKFSYDKLIVFTDNKSDMDVIKKANRAFVIINKHNRKYFAKQLLSNMMLIYDDMNLGDMEF